MASKIVQLSFLLDEEKRKETKEAEFKQMTSASFRALFAENRKVEKRFQEMAAHCEVVEKIVWEMHNRVDRMSEEMVKHV